MAQIRLFGSAVESKNGDNSTVALYMSYFAHPYNCTLPKMEQYSKSKLMHTQVRFPLTAHFLTFFINSFLIQYQNICISILITDSLQFQIQIQLQLQLQLQLIINYIYRTTVHIHFILPLGIDFMEMRLFLRLS